jgi:hypothetical protein
MDCVILVGSRKSVLVASKRERERERERERQRVLSEQALIWKAQNHSRSNLGADASKKQRARKSTKGRVLAISAAIEKTGAGHRRQRYDSSGSTRRHADGESCSRRC